MLTNYDFIRQNLDPYGDKVDYYVADEKAVQLFDNAQVRHLLKEDAKKSGRATPRDLETPFGQTIDKASAVAGYMDGTTKISSKSVDALRSWLNCTAMKSLSNIFRIS